MGKKSIICYTGLGAKTSGIHNDTEFISVASTLCKKNTKNCPANNNVNGWIEFSGAFRSTPEQCKHVVAQNKKIDNALKTMQVADAKFEKCVKQKRCTLCTDNISFAKCAAIKCSKASSTLAKKDANLKKAMADVANPSKMSKASKQ